MKILGIRFCSVAKEAEQLSDFFENGLGMPKMEIDSASSDVFSGAVFPAGESWIEMWPESQEMPAGIMLQIVVDDADEMAAVARENGLQPHGPTDAHGERIYYVQAPTGLAVSFQSKLR
jgi:hypothetical protein